MKNIVQVKYWISVLWLLNKIIWVWNNWLKSMIQIKKFYTFQWVNIIITQYVVRLAWLICLNKDNILCKNNLNLFILWRNHRFKINIFCIHLFLYSYLYKLSCSVSFVKLITDIKPWKTVVLIIQFYNNIKQ